MARIFHTPEISLPYDVRFADCSPVKVTSDGQLSLAYYVGNYSPRSAWYEWTKGPFNPPFLLESSGTGTTVGYTVYFNAFTGGLCDELQCHLQCTNQTISLVTGSATGVTTTFCINGSRPIYHFDIAFDSEGDRLALPATFQFTFEDSLGNQFIKQVESIAGVKPIQPIVGVKIDDSNKAIAYVGIVLQTVGFNSLLESNLQQYIIERCDWPSQTNVRIFKGPLNNDLSNKYFVDEDLSAGHEIAYRIRFVNDYGEESLNSDWVSGGI